MLDKRSLSAATNISEAKLMPTPKIWRTTKTRLLLSARNVM